jgi:hypothetical protein
MADIFVVKAASVLGTFEETSYRVGIFFEPPGKNLQRVPPAHLHVLGEVYTAGWRSFEMVEELVFTDNESVKAVQELIGLPASERSVFDKRAGDGFRIGESRGDLTDPGQRVGGEQVALFDRAKQRCDALDGRKRGHEYT